MADNIVSGLKQFEMPNPAVIGLQIANLGNIAAESKIRNKEVRDQQSLVSAYADEAGPVDYLQKNAPHLIPAFYKTQADVQKAQAENVQQQLKLTSDKVGLIGKTMSTVYDQDTYDKALNLLGQNQAIPSGVNPPKFYDPKFVQQASQWATTSLEKIISHQKDVEIGISQQMANTAAQKLPIEQQMANTGSGQLGLAQRQYLAPPVAPLSQKELLDLSSSTSADTGAKAALDTVVGNIDAITKPGSGLKNLTSPIGLGLAKIPLTKERDLATRIATVKDFYATQGLQLIRGGRVSEPLIKTAENLYTNLDPANGYESTIRSLNELKRISQIAAGVIDEKRKANINIINAPGGPLNHQRTLPNTTLPSRAPASSAAPKVAGQVFTMAQVSKLAAERGLKVQDVANTLIKSGYTVK